MSEQPRPDTRWRWDADARTWLVFDREQLDWRYPNSAEVAEVLAAMQARQCEPLRVSVQATDRASGALVEAIDGLHAIEGAFRAVYKTGDGFTAYIRSDGHEFWHRVREENRVLHGVWTPDAGSHAVILPVILPVVLTECFIERGNDVRLTFQRWDRRQIIMPGPGKLSVRSLHADEVESVMAIPATARAAV